MSEKNKNQSRPLNQKEVEEMLERGDSFEGLEIGDVDFCDHQFKNDVIFQGAKFVGIANFRRARFLSSTNYNGTEFSGEEGADFMDAEFSGDSGTEFIGAIFSGKGGADFSGAEFSGDEDINFFGAIFSGKGGADFMYAKFYGKGEAVFGDSTFTGEGRANFLEAKFSGEGGADFSGAEFSGDGGAFFMGARFSGIGGANFGWANFSGEGGANFAEALFYGERGAIFMHAKFSGKGGADFESAVFSTAKGIVFSDAEFLCEDRISFEDVTFEKDCIIYFDSVKLKYPKNLFFRNAYLGNTSFFQTDVENINLKNVKFRNFPSEKLNWFKRLFSIRREGLMDEIREIYHLEDDLTDFDEDYYSQVEIIYRQFKRNFEEKRDYAKAGDFHYGEMEMKRKRLGKVKKYISLTAFYKYFSGYGQKWGRAFIWFVGFVALFTFLNLIWLQPIKESKSNTDLRSDNNLEEISEPVTKFDSFLYTFNTMTLRKDSRFEITAPTGSLIVILQTMIGPVILALMLLAIRRQFRR